MMMKKIEQTPPEAAQAPEKAAQEAPFESNARYYGMLLDQMAHGFALHRRIPDSRPADYRFLDINPAFETITGLERHQVIGKTVREVLSSRQEDWAAVYREALLSGQPQNFEWSCEGQSHCFKVFPFPLTDAEGVILFLDITERWRTEQALREESTFRQAVIEGAAEGLCVCHNVPDHPFLCFTVWNRRMADITGYTLEEINRIGLFQALYPDPDMQKQIRLRMERVRDGENLVDEEWTITRRDDRQRVLRVSTAVLKAGARGELQVLAIIIDITGRKQMEQRLARSQENFRNVVLAHRSGVLILNPEGRVLFSNPAAQALLGRRAEELADTEWGMPSAVGHTIEVDICRSDRSAGVAEMTITSIEWEERPAYLVMLHDVTERKEAETRIQHMAYYDGLTGLPNRLLFLSRLSQALTRARRHRQVLAVLFLDLDHFKSINDTLGHTIGDQLLRVAAERLLACVRETDTVARLGGDEFTVLLEVPESLESVQQVGERILVSLQRAFHIDGQELFVGASIGISCYPQHGEDVETLIKQADAAMYRAKENGRNNVQFYTPDLGIHIATRLHLGNRLRKALECAEFVLHYQPQVDMLSGRMVGVEALLRWQQPERGLILPNDFIHVLEDTALIVAVGNWVLRTACAQNRAWQRAGLPPIRVAVNLSARQFDRRQVVGAISQVLEQTDLEARYLSLEITEGTLIENVEATAAALDRLSALGIQIAIDDFGTGYSSLGRLKRFAIHRLKIDRSFVRDLPDDPNSAAIAATITLVAHRLGIRVVAEGVETPAQLAFLQAQGCEEMQGYLFSPPVPAEEIARLLGEDGRLAWPPQAGSQG